MKWLNAARWGILISAISAWGHPAKAQHHAAGHPATGGGHAATGGHATAHQGGQMNRGAMTQQSAAHLQKQMMKQEQQQLKQYQHQMQQMQKQAHQQYQKDVQQFDHWLKANGHSGSSAGSLPKDPVAFDRWAATQKKNKAMGKSYDPMYDHYRSFADSMGGSKSGSHSRTAQSKKAAAEKHAEVRREEAAARSRGMARAILPEDQGRITQLVHIHSRLAEADRDYNGLRSEAMTSVGQAILHLGSSAPVVSTPAAGTLKQSQSDGILRDALVRLKGLRIQLSRPGNEAVHRVQARDSVNQAIERLEVALRTR